MTRDRSILRWVAGAVIVGALGAIPAAAAADVRLVLPAASLPGLRATGAPEAPARADLGGGLSSQLAGLADAALKQTSAARGAALRLRSDAFGFASVGAAGRVLAAWRVARHAAPALVGHPGYISVQGRATVTIAWREGDRIGVVSLSASRRVHDARGLALEYAVLADASLRAVLPTTAWGNVLAQIRPDGRLSKMAALQAFAVAYGSLPGVHAPPGRATSIPSGTLAAQSVLSYFSRLTGRQRRVVERVLGVHVTGVRARAADLGDTGFHQAAQIQSLIDNFVAPYETNLGHALGLKVVAGTTATVVKTKNGGTVFADSLPLTAKGGYGSGAPALCRVRVTPAGQAQSPDALGLILAHELFHCFQFDLRGASAWSGPPAWIGEGTADWASRIVDPVSYGVGGGSMTAYIGSPAMPLFERSYDAVGFWGHVQDSVGALWAHLPAVITAPDSRAAFVASGAESDAVLSTWGSSFLRYPGGLGGPPWQMVSPIVPPDLSALGTPADSINGSGIASAPPYTTSVAILSAASGKPVVHIGLQGIGRLSPVENYTDLKDAWFCTDSSGCTCPPDTVGSVPATLALGPQVALALTGNPDDPVGSFAVATAYPLDTFCRSKQQQPAPGHGSNPGVDNGDPYITTFDRGGYGFQIAGEFTLVKSLTDNLEIQSRQVPYSFRTHPEFAHSLAMNTAFAMRDSGATVEVDAGAPLVLYIDHRRRYPSAGQTIALPGGGRVKYGAGDTIVTWRDGTRAGVYSIGNEGVNIAVAPSARRAGLLRGLLGADDGHTADDFIGRDRRRYNPAQIQSVGLFAYTPADVRVLEGGFGRSWRITQRESLFVYPRGKSTRSYLVPGFPRVHVSLVSFTPGRRSVATGACRRAHVTNATLLAGCIIDYGATGSRLLATSTGTLQHAAGIPSSPTTTTTTPTISLSRVPWTQLSSQIEPPGTHVFPTIAATGGHVVAAYRRQSDRAIEAATFTPGSGGVSGLSRSLTFTGWLTSSDPVLLPAPGGGLQMIMGGLHSTLLADPLNGAVIAPRNPDGSFGTPTQLSQAIDCCVTGATLAADGSTPIWASDRDGLLRVYSGSTQNDLSADSPGTTMSPMLGRDASGRLWLAWYVFSLTPNVSGLYMMQLDPQTGAAAGPPTRAPSSDMGADFGSRPTMACAQVCRLVYVDASKLPGLIVSWVPGETAATTVLSGLITGRQQVLSTIAAAYTADGRLWISWADESLDHRYAKLGDAQGAGGNITQLQDVAGFVLPGETEATTIGNQLVLATRWQDASSITTGVWATVVNPA